MQIRLHISNDLYNLQSFKHLKSRAYSMAELVFISFNSVSLLSVSFVSEIISRALDMISDTKETDNKDTELKEMKTSSAIEYALDFKCLNDCKLYKSFDMCKRICMIPSILID